MEQPLEGDPEDRLFIDGFPSILVDEGGEHLVICRELIVANDLEVFSFIEAVIN